MPPIPPKLDVLIWVGREDYSTYMIAGLIAYLGRSKHIRHKLTIFHPQSHQPLRFLPVFAAGYSQLQKKGLAMQISTCISAKYIGGLF